MLKRIPLPLAVSFFTASALAAAMACSSGTTGFGIVGDASDTPDADPTTKETGTTPPTDAPVDPPGPDPLTGCTKDPGASAPQYDPNSATDPVVGGAAGFTMAMALAGFPANGGKLTAAISTEKSSIKCELLESVAPISVANFVGLARGTRPYKKAGKWTAGHFYDGLTWHRVIPNFVIQGGDPLGTGTGGPGYDLVDENHVDEPLGTLAMAASQKPSGSQFYVVVGKGPAANYNVFGTCSTENAIKIAAVARDDLDMPNTPVHMIKVEIARCP